MSEETALQQALEANQTLQDEIDRLRKTTTMLRRVNGSLRLANNSLRRQNEQAAQNDELFKQLCESGFGVNVTDEAGGLPDRSAVESTVANVEEAS
jgi:FtsZ-binding cell division protein ZapB